MNRFRKLVARSPGCQCSIRTNVQVGLSSFRSVGSSRRGQRGELEVEVGESGPRSVHREPHVGLQRLPDHRHQEQAEVRRSRAAGGTERRGSEIPVTIYLSQN